MDRAKHNTDTLAALVFKINKWDFDVEGFDLIIKNSTTIMFIYGEISGELQ